MPPLNARSAGGPDTSGLVAAPNAKPGVQLLRRLYLQVVLAYELPQLVLHLAGQLGQLKKSHLVKLNALLRESKNLIEYLAVA